MIDSLNTSVSITVRCPRNRVNSKQQLQDRMARMDRIGRMTALHAMRLETATATARQDWQDGQD